jgi:hypothetical protein
MSSPQKPEAKMSSLNPAQTGKSPAQTLPKSWKMQAQAWPGPTFGLKNQARARPEMQAWPRIFGLDRPGQAAHAQLYVSVN